jgi:hypothetical protein
MTEKPIPPERFSLSRWSRRKLEATAEAATPQPAAPLNAPASAPAGAPSAPAAAPELPSVASLNFDSDFSRFLRPEVDETLKRAALKQLFRDPRFNVMDGLDTYIDDYTKADPIEPGVLKEMLQRFSAVASTTSPPVEEATSPPEAPPAIPAAGVSAAESLPAATAESASAPSEDPQDPPEASSAPHSPS